MSDEKALREITEYLHGKIPITLAMGIRVTSFDGAALTLEAPLAANHNHLGTAFGGSLAAIATLAGYARVWLALENPDAHVVIRESTMKFRRPVRGSLRAVCRASDGAALDEFRQALARAGKARIDLDVTIEESGEVAVEFRGTFVAVQ
jgi:thioesterase domain-containing protein